MMKRVLLASLLAATAGALSVTLSAQLNFPEIPYDAVDPITANLPQDTYLGEAAGVATTHRYYARVMHEFFGAAAVLDEAQQAQQEAAAHLTRAFGSASVVGGSR